MLWLSLITFITAAVLLYYSLTDIRNNVQQADVHRYIVCMRNWQFNSLVSGECHPCWCFYWLFSKGYKLRNAYIAAQAPLRETVNDFWRMIWEFKSKAIVMLCNLEEGGQVSSSVVIYTTKHYFCSRKAYSKILLYLSKVVSKRVYGFLFHFAYSGVRIVSVTLS